MDSLMRKEIFSAILLSIIILLTSGCGKLEGDFGFKAPLDDSFRKATKTPEFRKEDRREWVFVFRDLSDEHEIGVFLMKKELVWVELLHFTRIVDKGDNTVFGTIEDLDEGTYKLMIVKKNDLIAEKEFLVYDDIQ